MSDLYELRALRLALETDIARARRHHKSTAALRKRLTLVTAQVAAMEAQLPPRRTVYVQGFPCGSSSESRICKVSLAAEPWGSE
tara:strand:+ start:687 stop:938 length:252 start_codon:yes stop_codon:yes gene_type:complete